MVVAIAPWSIVLQPGTKELLVPQGDVQIKNAALSDVLADETGRTTIKLAYPSLVADMDDDEDDDDDKSEADAMTIVVLCSLTPGKIEQASCEIILEQDVEYVFELVGKNPVYLYGNYIDQEPVDLPPSDSDMSSEYSEDEDAYNLAEVSSDVEVEVDTNEADLEEDASRFEELDEEMPEAKPIEKDDKKSLKRPRESDAAETDDAKLSKSQRKKLAKKLKAEGGNAAPPPTEEEPVEGEKKEEKKQKKDKKETTGKGEKETNKDSDKKQSRVLEGGVKVRDVKVGNGKMAKKGDKVSMRYVGKLTDGTIFDKNTKGAPFTFTLGAGDVIKGWDIGIAGMQIGSEREVTIPPSMGYGKKKMDDIPANSTLVFEVKLLSIK